MLKKWKHGNICTQCEEIFYYDSLEEAEAAEKNQLSDCCKAKLKYAGLQPYNESILKTPLQENELSFINNNKENESMQNQISDPEITNEIGEYEEVKESDLIQNVREEVPINIEEIPANTEEIDINNIIAPGKRGVSNAQMIPAIVTAAKENSIAKLNCLKEHYPEVFNGSIRYVGQKVQKQLKDMGF